MRPNFQLNCQVDPVVRVTVTPLWRTTSAVAAVRAEFGSADSAAAAHKLKTCQKSHLGAARKPPGPRCSQPIRAPASKLRNGMQY